MHVCVRVYQKACQHERAAAGDTRACHTRHTGHCWHTTTHTHNTATPQPQNPKDKRKIIVDEKLATIFTPPITMFNMNKQLSKHCFSKGEEGAVLLCQL